MFPEPVIICCENGRFLFVVDRKIRSEGKVSCTLPMLKFEFAAYYVFRLDYPSELSGTLYFIQDFLLGLADESGLKNKRTSDYSMLMTKLIKSL